MLATGDGGHKCMPCQMGMHESSIIYVYVLAGCALFWMVILSFLLFKSRKQDIMKAASPNYLAFMMLGGVLAIIPAYFQVHALAKYFKPACPLPLV